MGLSIVEVCKRDACSSSEVEICRLAGRRSRVGTTQYLEAVDFLETRRLRARSCSGDQSRSARSFGYSYPIFWLDLVHSIISTGGVEHRQQWTLNGDLNGRNNLRKRCHATSTFAADLQA